MILTCDIAYGAVELTGSAVAYLLEDERIRRRHSHSSRSLSRTATTYDEGKAFDLNRHTIYIDFGP